MATFGYLIEREQAIIDLVEALKIEVGANPDTKTVNPSNYDVWDTIKVNAQVLANLLEKVLDVSHNFSTSDRCIKCGAKQFSNASYEPCDGTFFMKTHLTLESENIKTGSIPVSTSSRQTCPDACVLKKHGCYAEHGPLHIHWDKVTAGIRGDTWKSFIDKINWLPPGQLWRHNQAGDLAGLNNTIDVDKLEQLTLANKGKRGFTYTHKPVLGNKVNARAICKANQNGFTINLSANNLAEADKLKALNIAPVVVVVDQNAPRLSYTPAGNKVIVCPAQQRDDVTCASCKLCAIPDRKTIIGFRAHGPSKNKVSAMVNKGNENGME